MHDDPDDLSTVHSRPIIDRGRLAVYTALGASVGALPLPWVPNTLLRQVRGALVQDYAVRYGLSLSREAREVLSEPGGQEGGRGFLSQMAGYLGARLAVKTLTRFGPVGLVWPLRDGIRTYALGHLFDRYLGSARSERAIRIDAQEARRVRRAIDGALVRAVTVEASRPAEPAAIDDQRDLATSLVDGFLSLAAGLPDRLVRRVDAAFDELLKTSDA